MDSLVLELQRECLASGVSVADLLRKALVVARKLGVKDLQSWIENELNGYDATIKVPSYRFTSGELKAWDIDYMEKFYAQYADRLEGELGSALWNLPALAEVQPPAA